MRKGQLPIERRLVRDISFGTRFGWGEEHVRRRVARRAAVLRLRLPTYSYTRTAERERAKVCGVVDLGRGLRGR